MSRLRLTSTVCLCAALFLPVVAEAQATPAPVQPAPSAAPSPAAAPQTAATPAAAAAVPAEQPNVDPSSIEQTEPAPPGAPEQPGVAPIPAAEEPEPPAEEPPPPKKLSVGTEGLFQPGLLLQAWFLLDRADETTTTFRMRRAELHAKGEIVPKLVGYALMIDAAKVLETQNVTLVTEDGDEVTVKQPPGAISVFQDLFITFQSPYVDASIGQFKIPVSWEGYNSSSKLLFAERAPVSREFGDKRDIGLRFAKAWKYFGYSAGLFNGAGQNNLDTNNAKDIAARLEAYPIEGMTIAGVGYTSVGDRGESSTKDRLEGDFRYESGPFLFQSEYIWGHDVTSSGEADGQGFYAAVAWTFIDVLQPALRFGYLDPDTDVDLPEDAAKDELFHVDVGLNYYIQKHEAKLQLDYSRFEYDDSTPNNEVIFAAQVGF